ncbi:Surp module [Tothia fuscella]|uniref:Surp module n=1 Tax=Tothia fuscella TaxID=1048955 RepID=A0A9P4P4J3_9PEZI|nr:Surp module [Tothia fuscella]
MAPSAVEESIDAADEIFAKAPPGVILPPKEIRVLVEKSAGYVVRNGKTFEDRIRTNESNNPRFSFINPEDPYHNFYQWRMDEIRGGRSTDVADGRAGEAPAKAVRKGPEQPPEFQFSARMPTVNASDLDIVKLTALFAAKNGRAWITQLSQREAGNYQFDFLRPQHSLHQFFTRLQDQYQLLLNTTTVEGAKAAKARRAELQSNVQNRFHVLNRAKQRAEWIKHQESQKAKKEELEAAEQRAFAEIDWHDFTIVGEILFTEEDEHIDLPPPTSLNDLQSASMEQKAQYKLTIEEAPPTETQYYPPAQQMQPPAQFLPQQPAFPPQPIYPQQPQFPQQPAAFPQQPQYPQMPVRTVQEEEEEARIQERQAERERANQAMAAARGATGPMRIVPGGAAPRAAARKKNVPMAQCPNCRQQIPYDELDQHMKIELLDPRWREQKAKEQQRASTTNISTSEVANNLKRLASQRTDVFDPVTGQSISKEEDERRKRAAVSYDGNPVTANAALGQGLSVEDQIKLIHQRAAQGGQ